MSSIPIVRRKFKRKLYLHDFTSFIIWNGIELLPYSCQIQSHPFFSSWHFWILKIILSSERYYGRSYRMIHTEGDFFSLSLKFVIFLIFLNLRFWRGEEMKCSLFSLYFLFFFSENFSLFTIFSMIFSWIFFWVYLNYFYICH